MFPRSNHFVFSRYKKASKKHIEIKSKIIMKNNFIRLNIFRIFINDITIYLYDHYINLIIAFYSNQIDFNKNIGIFTYMRSNHIKKMTSLYLSNGFYYNQSFSVYE
jgi:hypothetical protein